MSPTTDPTGAATMAWPCGACPHPKQSHYFGDALGKDGRMHTWCQQAGCGCTDYRLPPPTDALREGLNMLRRVIGAYRHPQTDDPHRLDDEIAGAEAFIRRNRAAPAPGLDVDEEDAIDHAVPPIRHLNAPRTEVIRSIVLALHEQGYCIVRLAGQEGGE